MSSIVINIIISINKHHWIQFTVQMQKNIDNFTHCRYIAPNITETHNIHFLSQNTPNIPPFRPLLNNMLAILQTPEKTLLSVQNTPQSALQTLRIIRIIPLCISPAARCIGCGFARNRSHTRRAPNIRGIRVRSTGVLGGTSCC